MSPDKHIAANADIRHACVVEEQLRACVVGQDMHPWSKSYIVTDSDMKAMRRINNTAAQLAIATYGQSASDQFVNVLLATQAR